MTRIIYLTAFFVLLAGCAHDASILHSADSATISVYSDTLEYKVIQRYDYPGLNTNRNFSTFYAFPWQTQLHFYEQQGWSFDSVAFTTNKLGVQALVTLKHAKR